MKSCRRTDLGGECEHVSAGEGRVQSRHLIEQTTQRPDVSLLTVSQVLNYLRTIYTHTETHRDTQTDYNSNRVPAVVEVHVRAKFHQAKCSGS